MASPDFLSTGHGASTLMVMLPGALMTPQHMQDAGVFDAVRQRGLDLDIKAVNLHALGANHFDALRILAEDIVMPARGNYQNVWLTGISRGGQLALSCLAEGAAVLDGVCLLAPYPGSRLTINAIERAGGLNTWLPSEDELKDSEFRMWRWLRQPALKMPMFFGYGAQDRFADGMQRLANQLPMAEQARVEGGHDWAAWMPLWERFLDAGHFKERA
jgi:pimeloyl-ACP methyl ester carboxylesterase